MSKMINYDRIGQIDLGELGDIICSDIDDWLRAQTERTQDDHIEIIRCHECQFWKENKMMHPQISFGKEQELGACNAFDCVTESMEWCSRACHRRGKESRDEFPIKLGEGWNLGGGYSESKGYTS